MTEDILTCIRDRKQAKNSQKYEEFNKEIHYICWEAKEKLMEEKYVAIEEVNYIHNKGVHKETALITTRKCLKNSGGRYHKHKTSTNNRNKWNSKKDGKTV